MRLGRHPDGSAVSVSDSRRRAIGLFLAATPALACGGLIGPNGAVNLLRTTTFAGYHDGVEHYVTAFQFAGGGGAFGSITPLPGIPTSVEKGGDWTLQRLIRETNPVRLFALDAASPAASAGAQELMTVKIDALDITVLKGGARTSASGRPSMASASRPTPHRSSTSTRSAHRSSSRPPSTRTLQGARPADRRRDAGSHHDPDEEPLGPAPDPGARQDRRRGRPGRRLPAHRPPAGPAPVPVADNGIRLDASEQASNGLLSDLRSDRGMDWVPQRGWLTKVAVDGTAGQIGYDLAVDASGEGRPSAVDAGLALRAARRSRPRSN
jgi:hypothetical protein